MAFKCRSIGQLPSRFLRRAGNFFMVHPSIQAALLRRRNQRGRAGGFRGRSSGGGGEHMSRRGIVQATLQGFRASM